MRWQVQVAALAGLQSLSLSVVASDFPALRIQPLGDSITKGSQSSHNNGYREYLRNLILDHSDNEVDMIGSQRAGNMADNDHEGHSGHFLREIGEFYKLSIRARPNLVLIHAGINNMDKEIDVEESPELMEKLIDGVHKDAPDAAILVMPIIWANNSRLQNNTDHFNRALGRIIEDRLDDDMHIISVPTNITIADLHDIKHPNDQGYMKMANAWFRAIRQANDRGWIEDPVEVNADDLPGMGLGTKSDAEEDDEESAASRSASPLGLGFVAGLLGRATFGPAWIWNRL